jgi:peroxisomal 2,4-dienoyl-CoA reductase
MEIDTFGTFIASKFVYSLAMKDKGGVIINITAGLHYNGTVLQLHSGTAKAGVDALTKHLAVELGPKKVRVNGICPGPISDTEGFSRLSGEKSNRLRLGIPVQ